MSTASLPSPFVPTLAHVLVPLGALFVLVVPRVSAAIALVVGIALALTVGNPFAARTRRATHTLLAVSITGLGAGTDLVSVARAGANGIGYTAVGIAATIALGLFLGRRFGVAPVTSLLLTVGTAICGGSAIAAVSPVVGAREHEVSVSLATVFLLNAVALVVFPLVGHRLGMDARAFGLWCALAIHDTSSVVGAAMTHSPQALAIATTIKLARALWIVPVTATVGVLHARRTGSATGARPAVPWFIVGFVAAALVVTLFPVLRPLGQALEHGAHRVLVLTLFLVGLGLTRDALGRVGPRALAQGVVLWVCTATATLGAILAHWMR